MTRTRIVDASEGVITSDDEETHKNWAEITLGMENKCTESCPCKGLLD